MNISNKKAIAICSHLRYEITMLERMATELSANNDNSKHIKYAFIESFAIHSRNLIDFLYKDASGDDVSAVDFFENKDLWEKIRPNKPALLVETSKRANKTVAHLTYKRIYYSTNDPSWKYQLIAHKIRLILLIFYNRADIDKLGDWGTELLQSAINKTPNFRFLSKSIYEQPILRCYGNIPLHDI